MSGLFSFSIITPIMRVMTPVLLCALGSVYSNRSGLTNITLEGAMLVATFTGVVGSYFTGSTAVAVLFAILGAVLVNLFYGLLHLKWGGDAVVCGFAINSFCLVVTTFLLRTVFKTTGNLISDQIVGLARYDVPLLHRIPVLEYLFSNQTLLAYLAILMVFVTQVILPRTRFGMNVRACGENPAAAATVGVNVVNTRWLCILITGVLVGLAGAQLSLGNLTMFSENMTSGRGFIALAAVILSRGRPYGVFITSILFGLAEAVSNLFQLTSASSYLVMMIPYAAVIIILVLQPERLRAIKIMLSRRKEAA